MATAAAPAADAGDAPPKKGKKKLIIILAAVLFVVLAGGGAAVFMMKKKAAEEAAAAEAEADGEEGDHAAPAKGHAKKDEHKGPPTFVPLDPFVVNLADKETDRYAQIGITLQIADAKFADELKTYLPAVRNGILMVLAHKTSKELLERKGKERLAAEIMREAVRPMGIEIAEADPPEDGQDGVDPDAEEKPKPKKKKKKPAGEPNPITSVNFSSFIIQ